VDDPLDDHLSSASIRILQKPKLLLRHIRDAYPIGIPALSIKSTTDRIGLDAGYAFHLGTPEPELRRIASWVLTKVSDTGKIEEIIGRLWQRYGREDLVLSSILLANLPDDKREINWKWITLTDLISHVEKKRKKIPIEVMLLHIEEMARANYPPMDEEFSSILLEGTPVEMYFGILGIHQASKKIKITESFKNKLRKIELSEGDSILRRIRDRVLNNA
jgi:hypothetical protein